MDQEQEARYLRQTIFAPLGKEGQERLLAARVLVAGVGATGSVIANTLARAGVGRLELIDRDYVELSNLQRQVLYDEADAAAGIPKAVAAARHLRQINSSVTVEPLVTDLNVENVEDLVRRVDLVLDGTDNFETRYLINEACVKHERPWVYGGAVGSYGSTMTIIPRETACFRCLFPNAPPPGALATCDTAGVIGPVVNVIGGLVAAEALKLLSGRGARTHDLTAGMDVGPRTHDLTTGMDVGARNPGLVHVDVWENSYDSLEVQRNPDCPVCVHGQYEALEGAGAGILTALLCGRNSVQVRPARGHTLDLPALEERLNRIGQATYNTYLVQFVIGDYRMTIFPDARVIVQGTEDETVAKNLYARYIGT